MSGSGKRDRNFRHTDTLVEMFIVTLIFQREESCVLSGFSLNISFYTKLFTVSQMICCSLIPYHTLDMLRPLDSVCVVTSQTCFSLERRTKERKINSFWGFLEFQFLS